MSKLLLAIKKILAIIISFFINLFKRNNSTNYQQSRQTKSEKTNTKSIISKETNLASDEDKGKKQKEKLNFKQNEISLYQVKQDLQKLFIIEKNIFKLETAINQCDNLEDLYILQKQIEQEKTKFLKITTSYINIKTETKLISEIKAINDRVNKQIIKTENLLNNKIYKLKKENLIVNEENIKEKEVIKEQESKQNSNKIKKHVAEAIIENTVIYNANEFIKKVQLKNNEKDKKTEKFEKKDSKLKSDTKLQIKKLTISKPKKEKQEIKKENQFSKLSVKKEILNDNIFKITNLKNKKRILVLIGLILAKASTLTKNAINNSLYIINPTMAVHTSLLLNNEIRKARSIGGAKVSKLKMEKVIKKIGMNPKLQLQAIINNSLSQISKLKIEIQQYGISDEVLNILNNLTELELDLINQKSELEKENNLNSTRTR